MSQYGSDPNQPDQGGQPDQPYGTPPAPQNPYGTPAAPQNPYAAPATPNPYGTPPSADQAAYGQPPAGQDPYGAPAQNPYGPAGVGTGRAGYASWIKRVGGYLVDGLLTAVAAVPAYVLLFSGIAVGTKNLTTYTDTNGVSHTTGHWNGGGTALVLLGLVLLLVPLAFFIWNTCLRQGRTGYTIGKGLLGIRLVSERTRAPIGAGMSFLRWLCHLLDGICYIGYLWPLWDAKSQTFADKIMSTIVIDQPKQG